MIDIRARSGNAVLFAVICIIKNLCGVKESLCGDTSLVEADATEGSLLENESFESAVRGSFSGIVACRAAAEDYKIIHFSNSSSLLCKKKLEILKGCAKLL